MDFAGKTYETLSFEYDDATEVYASCGAFYQGVHYVFGGAQESRQVSRIQGCRLIRESSVPFTFQNGACGIFFDPNLGKEVVLLCFDDDANLSDNTKDAKVCYEYDGTQWSSVSDYPKLPETRYHHTKIRLADYKGTPFAVAGQETNQVESFNFGTKKWVVGASYTLASGGLSQFAVINFREYFVIMGGLKNQGGQMIPSNEITEYRDGKWRKIGEV